MSHKTLVRIAIVMVIVFGFITIVYPRIFSPTSNSNSPIELTPPATPPPPAP